LLERHRVRRAMSDLPSNASYCHLLIFLTKFVDESVIKTWTTPQWSSDVTLLHTTRIATIAVTQNICGKGNSGQHKDTNEALLDNSKYTRKSG
jgi:hypothetical protein